MRLVGDYWKHMGAACLVVGCLPTFSQTTRVSPVTKGPGDEVTLEISVASQPARAPIALKWDVIFPAQVMDMESQAPGSAAMQAGKSLQCKLRKPYAYTCILAGGQNLIPDGQVAVYHLKVKPMAEAGSTTFRIENLESTTADSKNWALNPTESNSVIVR
jgi:hypothetical protein